MTDEYAGSVVTDECAGSVVPTPPTTSTAVPSWPADSMYNSGLPPSAKAFQAGIESGIHGLTAGLSDYAQGGYQAATGPISFADALAGVRARRAALSTAYPAATTTGNIGGQVTTGVLTGGAGIVPNMLKQGAQGALTTYTDSADTTLTDAGKSGLFAAGVSGAVGQGAKWLGQGGAALSDWIDNAGIKNNIAKVRTLAQDAADSTSATYQQSRESLKSIFGMESWGTQSGAKQAAKDYISQAQEGLTGSVAGGKPGIPQSLGEAAQNSQSFSKAINSTPAPGDGSLSTLLSSAGSSIMHHPLGPIGAVYGAVTDQ